MKPPKKKRPSSSTADNLEELLHLFDEKTTIDAGSVPERQARKPAASRAPKPPRENPPSPTGASSFMQELARARADLHKERRSRIALKEETESLRREVSRLAAYKSEHDALRRECEGLQKKLADLEKQRRKLHEIRLDLESQLDAEQREREQLNDRLDAINRQLAAERSRRDSHAVELEALRQRLAEIEQRPEGD